MTEPTLIRLRPGADHRVKAGHPWVFSNQIAGDVAALPPGGAVDVLSAEGAFLGRGYANPASLISVRLLTRQREDIESPAFYAARLRTALDLRARVRPGRGAYRLVAGEADLLPGLIIDRYDDVLVVQVSTLGLEARLPALQQAITEVLAPRAAVLRNDAAVRLLEGLPQERRLWFGEAPGRVRFEVDGGGPAPLALWADVLDGQKTGFFFDQCDNRAWGARLCGGARVLDLYANTGAWALAALGCGATSATAVEINARTCELIAANAALNGAADRLEIAAADVREWLASAARAGARYDVVFLDPPAFAKNRKSAGAALKAYRDVNRAALAVLRPGGLLFTSSCSFHVEEARFEEEVLRAGASAGRLLRQIRRGEQGPDHPVLPGVPETRYLKHLVFQAL